MGLPYGEEIMIVGRTMWTQSTSVTDRQTDGQTELRSQMARLVIRAVHCCALYSSYLYTDHIGSRRCCFHNRCLHRKANFQEYSCDDRQDRT